MKPPFVPNVSEEQWLENFDPEFTSQSKIYNNHNYRAKNKLR